MSQTERLFRIEQIVRSRRGVKFGDLQDELEVSRATLKRDIEYLRSRMRVPIVFDREIGGYRLEPGKGGREAMPGLWFNASEAQALLTMHHMLGNLQPGILQRHVEPLLDRLKAMIESGDHSVEEIQRRVRILHLGRRAPKLRFFETAAGALLNRKRLAMTYYSRASDAESERTVSPQRMVFYRENWYLDGWCHLREDLRSFAVDGIRKAAILEEPAKAVADRALDEVLGESYGIFSGRARQTARLKFTPERARWVATEEWHPKQKGEPQADGSYVLEIPYNDDRELVGDILRHGAEVEVLGPPELREHVRAEIERAGKVYRR